MEPVRFADVLFVLLVCVITFGILALVNRKRFVGKGKAQETTEGSETVETETRPPTADQE